MGDGCYKPPSLSGVQVDALMLRSIVQGSATAVVQTANGPVPSVAKRLAEAAARINYTTKADFDELRNYVRSPEVGLVYTLGRITAGDQGGGAFYFDPADTLTTDDGVLTIVAADGSRWRRAQPVARIDARMFGAQGDGLKNDTLAIQDAIDYAESLGAFLRRTVFLPVGDYAIDELILRTEVSIVGEDWRNTRLRGIGGAGTAMIKAAGDGFLGGAIQSIENFTFIPDGSQAVDGIDLTAASNTNGIHFDQLWFNNVDTAIRIGDDAAGKTFGDLWFGAIVVELSNNGVWLENGDDVHFADLLSFKNDGCGLYLKDVEDFELSRFRCTETGGVNSSQYAVSLNDSRRIVMPSSLISQLTNSSRPSGRLVNVNGCRDLYCSNFDWQGRVGSEGQTERGLNITGACDNLNFSNGRIAGVYGGDTGTGITAGNGVASVTRAKFSNVHTADTGGAGIKQANNADLELHACTTDEAMVGSASAVRPGWDLRSNGDTTVIGGRVGGSNLTAGHGIHCGGDSDKKLIGVTAGDGITATGSTRVFVDSCDTLGSGNLAQVVSQTIAPGSVAAGAQYDTTVTLTGARLGDAVDWAAGTTTLGGLQITVRVGTTDTIDIDIHNPTGSTITPSSSAWTFKLRKLA